MSVPTHNTSCITRAYKTRCPDCKEDVYFFTCTCGTKVFFDGLDYPWPLHHCPQYDIREAIQLIQDADLLTDTEIYDRIKEYAKKHNKHIPQKYWEIIDRKLVNRRKPFKCIKMAFDENISGAAGKIIEINPKVNFAKRFGYDHKAPFIAGLLGELSKSEFTEIVIRDSPDENNYSREYSFYVKSAEFRTSGIRRSDVVTFGLRPSKSVDKVWVVYHSQII